MIRPKAGFTVYGMHKDGLKDPMGEAFFYEEVFAKSIKTLSVQGIEVIKHETVVVTKAEAKKAMKRFKDDDLLEGIGMYVKFEPEVLPFVSQRKMSGEKGYALALEPLNTPLDSRKKLREKNILPFIDGYETKEFEIKIGIAEGSQKIDQLRNKFK